jgi:RimJ/RimL family protein N-acetyltransferase
MKAYARDTLSLQRLVAVALATNASSVRVLGALGFQAETTVRWSDDSAELTLFGCTL